MDQFSMLINAQWVYPILSKIKLPKESLSNESLHKEDELIGQYVEPPRNFVEWNISQNSYIKK